MINDKYRVNEVAKDLNVQMKDIVDLLEKNFPGEKKRTTVLTNEELNFVFETYTQQHQQDNLDSYYAYKVQSQPVKQEKAAAKKTAAKQPKEEKEVKEQPQQEQQVAAAEPEKQPALEKHAEEKAPQEENKEMPVKKTQTEREKQDMSETPKRPAPETRGGERKKAAPQENRPADSRANENRSGERSRTDRPRNDRPERNDRGTDRSAKFGDKKPQGERRFNDRPERNDRGGRFGDKKPQDRPKQAAKPQAPKPAPAPRQASTINPELDENVNGKMIRHVDMRAANVDLDKYNERYEHIAPENMSKRDDGVKKQKIGGRNNKKKNFMSKKDKEMEKLKRLEMERERRQKLHITLPDEITVGELALKLKIQSAEIVKRLMMLGEMKSVSDVIDYDTAALVAMEIGAKVEKEVVVTIEDRLFDDSEDKDEQKVERPPVVVVMGHVDHGKTSILDAIRHSDVTSTEAGGITQHIGAYQVNVNGKLITFLDTPGHEAFTAMRARGANMTDIAVLVVAADDGIMPQTVESINHAKAANVKIIVAMNKMDKPTANPERVMEGLTKYGIITEDWGGDVACIPVSALTGMGINDLLERIALEAEVMELKANPNRRAKGAVVEARLDKGQGPIATILVQNGTLHSGDVIIAGTAVGRVRTMRSDKGQLLSDAGPSTPVEITGLTAVPEAGDLFEAVEDERLARELADKRTAEAKEKQFAAYTKVTLDNLFDQMAANDMKELPIVVKADVQGSAEAVKQSLEKISNDEVRVRVIHAGVGAISKSDVSLADASNAIIIGFNVRPDAVAKAEAEQTGVEMRMYRVIYDAINDVSDAMKGMLAPKVREVALGEAQVRQVYKISSVGTVAGCRVTDGKITRDAQLRLVRDGIVICEDSIASLKRFKDDAKEVAEGFECGITLAKFQDIKEGDVFECFKMEEYRD